MDLNNCKADFTVSATATQIFHFNLTFLPRDAMHYSAKHGVAIACRLSVYILEQNGLIAGQCCL